MRAAENTMKRWETLLTFGALAFSAALGGACGSGKAPPGFQPDGGALLDASDAPPTFVPPPEAGAETGCTPLHPQPAGSPVGCDPGVCTPAGGQCANNACVIGENLGAVDGATQGQLRAGGTADALLRWLYPYNQTVFPRGLLPPTLQFDGDAPDAVYLHISCSSFQYDGFFGASNPGQVTLSPAVWKALTFSAAPREDVQVQLSKISKGKVSGPVVESWNIAPGSLRGTIYYETYDSQIIGAMGGLGVGIMRIQPGASKPDVIKQACGNVCHTASADGSTLVANTGFPAGSASYDLRNPASPINSAADDKFTYGGIYPDGSFVISSTNYRTWLMTPSHVYDTRTGNQLSAPGFDGVVTNASMPAFSPDGKFLVFNDEDNGAGHSLATMKFAIMPGGDAGGVKTFSNLTPLAHSSSYLGWPAFTPDSKWVIYHDGSSPVFETDQGATGDLYYVNVASKATGRLDALNGYGTNATCGTNGQSYLPASDPGLNFAPTVLPEAVGGYFWVVFTSHRSYGNTFGSRVNNDQDGKLWVAAFDVSTGGVMAMADPSHPAFYLDGQEPDSDNLRGYWVLPPCNGDGVSCTSGDECCNGFCRPGSADGGTPDSGGSDASDSEGGAGTGYVCVPPPGGCSHEYEKCNAASDCCDPADLCINGRCANIPK
jgi:hypothetical protein